MSVCPSCGREVGSHVTCPHCGANLKRRLTLSLFGLLAIVLAVGGLALLYTVSLDTAIPAIRIGQIQAAMNYAYVRVEGEVTRLPKFDPDSESLTFWIDDGTGRMRVSAFKSDARALIDSGRVPLLGDRVSVEGVLGIRDEVPALTINSVDSLRLTRLTDTATPRDLSSITAADAMKAVTVRGQVRAVREPGAAGGPRLITIRDATGEIDVAIDKAVEALGAPAPEVKVGDSIEVTGVVTLFEETLQISVMRGPHLSMLSNPITIAETRAIRSLRDSDIGKWVRVQGTIARVAPFSSGVKFTLDDAFGQAITLLLWQDVFAEVPDAAEWQIGAELVAQGEVSSFRGELEIVPGTALDVSLLTRAAAAPSPKLNLAQIGSITQADVGSTVFVSGTIASVDQFSSGVRFRLEDGSGSIVLALFSDIFDQVENNDQLKEGTGVSALGRVSEFNGALEVIPPNGASVRVSPGAQVAQITPTPEPPRVAITPVATETPAPGTAETGTPSDTPTPSVTPRPTPAAGGVIPIASIDQSLIGQTVPVRGQVRSTASFSAGFRFTLTDGSGSIDLILFDGRYREVADRASLNLGAQVTVTAVVAEFDATLGLQPDAGQDVVIDRPGSPSIVTVRAINTLSKTDVGTLVAIVGDVLRVEKFSSGVRAFVNDGTGEQVVVIFNNVLNYVPNAPSLQAGSKARVVGRIDESNGALELVPALGYDVTVNP